MVTPARIRGLAATWAIALAATVSSSYAQGLQPYAGGLVGSFSLSTDDVDGRSASTGLVAGIAIARFADVEVEILVPSDSFVRSITGPSVSFAPRDASRAEIERLAVIGRTEYRREVKSNISAVVIFRPPPGPRFRPGVLVGVTNQHVRVEHAFTPLVIPEGVDPLHPSVVARVDHHTRNMGGPTFGANLIIAVTRRLAIIPDVRYDYGSIGDEINNTLRTSVKVVWHF